MLRGNGDPEYRRRIREKAEKDQQIAETERREANNKYNIEKIAAAIERVGQKLDRTNDEQTPQKKSDRRWERFGFLGLWFAGFVGIAAILVGTHDSSEQRGVMQGQLNTMQSAVGQSGETIGTMKAQADIMRGQLNEMEIARRPWITADFGIAGPLEMKDGALTTTLGIILRNTGQTPAVRTDIAIDLFPVQAFDIYNSVHTACMQVDNSLVHDNTIGPSVFPNEIKPMLTYNISISKGRMEEYYKIVPAYQKVVIMPVVALCIGYKEFGWNTFHHTSFILRYTTKDPIRDVKLEEMPINAIDLVLRIFPVGNLSPD